MTERLPDTLAARMMQESSSRDVDDVCYHCQTGNRFWLESLSDQNLSLAFSVDGISSPIVPPGRETPTLLFNTREGTRGKLEMSINGEATTILKDIDGSLIESAEDLACGLIFGPQVEMRSTTHNSSVLIPFSSGVESDGEQFTLLPDGVDERNTEIDMVMVWLAPPGACPVRQGLHEVDDLNDRALNWLWECVYLNTSPDGREDAPSTDQRVSVTDSLLSNSTSTIGGEVVGAGGYLVDVGRQYDRHMIVSALKELMARGRFYVRQIPSWGGRYAVVFRGLTSSRSFLTAAMYGIDNARVNYISSYAQVASSFQEGSPGRAMGAAVHGSAPSVTRASPFITGNFIGFLISGAFDVKEFMEAENPEENWGGLLGALGVTFVKVWAAGFTGLLIAGFVASAVASAPVLLIVGIGAVVAITVGVGLDWLDNKFGVKEWIKEKARHIGQRINSVAVPAFLATVDFFDSVHEGVRQRVGRWVEEAGSRLHQAGESIWGMIFCDYYGDDFADNRFSSKRRWCIVGVRG